MAVSKKIARAEEICGHTFHDRTLLRSAITHPSAVEGEPVQACYERLEFLGDAILGALVSVALYESYPELDEGQLTHLKVSLISGATLSKVGQEIGLDEVIIFGPSESGTGARGMHSALENVYEAIVGALYLDGGWDAAGAFITATLRPHLSADPLQHPSYNPKGYLQERVQADHLEAPAYKVIDESGPAHDPTFTAVVIIDGVRQGRGQGSSKKEAECAAAQDALERLGYIDPADHVDCAPDRGARPSGACE